MITDNKAVHNALERLSLKLNKAEVHEVNTFLCQIIEHIEKFKDNGFIAHLSTDKDILFLSKTLDMYTITSDMKIDLKQNWHL